MIAALDFSQCANKTLDLLRAVADGEVGQNVADVAELDLNVVFITQNVVHLNACKADVQRVNAQFCRIKVENGVAVAKLLAEGIVPAHGVDLLARVLGHVGHLMEHLPAPQCQIAAGNVKARHQKIAAGGCLGQVDDLPHIARMDIGTGQQQAGLGQAAAALVHRDGGHISARRHGGDRQSAAEVEVGAVRFIGKAEHTGVMRHPHNGAQIAADAVVGGVVDQHRHGIGMLGNRFRNLLTLHAKADAQPGIDLGVDIDRHGTAQHQRVQHAAVDIAGQNDLIAALAGGQHHALHRAGRAADHQKGIRRTERLGGQFLSLPDDRYRVAEVIQRLHAVDIHPNTLLTQKGSQLGVAAAALVPGHIKGDNAHFSERFQCLVDRRTALIQTGTLRISVHFSLRPQFLCK